MITLLRTIQRHFDLLKMVLIVRGNFVKLLLQGSHASFIMHKLKMATAFVVQARLVDDSISHG